ncbi:MAG: GNAT family N-acetyltransferase [Lachnospiraceae bacterium]|nr:GNAT family N-acetyltransferase [Lachnospiraceae bacterium]
MILPEEKLTLKDGRTVIIRTPEEKDAQALLDYLKKTAGETDFLIRYPEEITFTLESEYNIINSTRESEDSAWFTVFEGDRVVGNCTFSPIGSQMKFRHRCSIAIALEQSYCSCGLGAVLFERAIDTARKIGYEQIELGVFEDNDRGRALYKKMGFEEYGRIPHAVRLKDGSYKDEITMVLFLQ